MADQGDRAPRARICIDFGTALSKACLCIDPMLPLEAGVKPIPIGAVAGAEHPLLTPSVLFVDEGRLFFGPAAFEHARRGVTANRDPLLSFKTVLGAANPDEALAQKMRPSVDPTGTLRTRDALVLYLAYLDQLIREALARTPNVPPGIADAKRRYTSPVWSKGGGNDLVFERIFNEATAISYKLGRLFLLPDGISIAQCKDALDKAARQPGDARLETGVFEPHAAAAASLAFTNSPTRFVYVFDMGAGTTDIAAFDFNETVEPPSLTEIKEARICSALAGDEIDRILIDLILRKRGSNGAEEDKRFLRMCQLYARDLKRELFATGRCSVKEGWKTTVVRGQDLMEDPQFRDFIRKLQQTIAQSLSGVAARARAEGSTTIDVVLAGGGSHLPFINDLVRGAAGHALSGSNITLRVAPLSPASEFYATIDQYFAGVFPQIAMSIGGSLVEMLDAPVR
ncbi:MAG: Hsp70 family protein [Hyphomonadaceae bacterium]